MPELRVLMDHLVNRAVEQSIAPLLAKQNELEAALRELRNCQVRFEKAASASAKDITPARAAQAEAHAQAVPAVAVMTREHVTTAQTTAQARSRVGMQAAVAVVADDASASLELPAELNGLRRKKIVVAVFAVGLLVLLLSVAGLSVLSNLGTYL